MKKQMRPYIIDLENHIFGKSAIEEFKKRNEAPCIRNGMVIASLDANFPIKFLREIFKDIDERINEMDTAHIDAAVLSSTFGVENLPAVTSVAVARAVNDEIASMVKKYPKRFWGSAVLPVRDVKAAVKELERCVKEYGFVAWHCHSNFGDLAPDNPMFKPIFKKAQELGVYVYLHPNSPEYERIAGFGVSLSTAGMGYTIDTMITTARLILGGMLDEVPNLKIVLGHLGEAFPFLMERMDNRTNIVPDKRKKNRKIFSEYFKDQILVTTSGNASVPAFECTKKVLGIDRITIGTDWPYENISEFMKYIFKLKLTDTERAKLYSGNAKRILGLKI